MPVGGRLQSFLPAWKKITRNPWVLDIIRYGLKMEWITEPSKNPKEEMYLSEASRQALEEEIRSIKSKEAIEIASEKGVISALFTVPKQSGKLRPVWDGRWVNQFVVHRHFKMESLLTAKDLIQRDDWMTSIDISDAYLHLAVEQTHRKFLQFRWENQTWQFRAMPFGLSSAPRIFTKIMRCVMEHLRQKGLRCVIYLDDLLIMAKTKEEIKEHTRIALELMIELGWKISWNKSELTPSRVRKFLGMEFDTHKMEIRIPRDKLKDILACIQKILSGGEDPTLRELASISGKILAIEMAVMPTRLKTWSLIKLRNSHLQRGWESRVPLNDQARAELEWWTQNLTGWNGRSLLIQTPQQTVTTDASPFGWGAHCQVFEAQGMWKMEEQDLHNNVKELLGGGYGLRSFQDLIRGKVVLLQMDNTTAVSYINKMGGRKQELHEIAQEIWEFCISNEIQLTAQYIPGKMNEWADRLSRVFPNSTSDWMLNPEIWRMVNEIWGPHEIDLFASMNNRQLPKYIAWKPDPEAFLVDAFKHPWKSLGNCYGNPPFNQFGRILAKIRKERIRMTIIAPIWPNQPWFPDLLSMMIDYPILLPDQEDLYLPGFLGNQQPMGRARWRSIAARISGNPNDIKTFQSKISTSSMQELILRLRERTRHNGNSSRNGSTKELNEEIFSNLQFHPSSSDRTSCIDSMKEHPQDYLRVSEHQCL